MKPRNKRGAGSTVKIGDLWYARWRIKGETVYGDQGHRDRDDAERDRLKGPDSTPKIVKKSTIPTLRVFAHECMLARYGQGLADSTFETNESIRTNQVEASSMGKKRLDKITPADCQNFADSIKKQLPNGSFVPASPSWVRRVCAFVSKVMTLAIKEGYIKANPMHALELPEVEERDNRTLAPEEAITLLSPERRIDALMLVSLHTGMRRSELIRLQWGDVTAETIKITQTKGKKGKKPIPMTSEAYAAIMAQPKISTFVFCTDSGKPLSPRNVSRDVKNRKAQIGIPEETRLHDLRGTFGSLMLEGGVDLKTVQDLMRHKDARTTIKMYLRSRTETKVAAIEIMRKRTGGKDVETHQPKEGEG